MLSVACQPCRERAVGCLDSIVAVVNADNDTLSGNPPYYNGYKMENLKTNRKLLQKARNPRNQWEIGYGEIENILKTAGFILFLLKKIAPTLPNSGKRQKKWASRWANRPKNGWTTL